MQPEDPVVTQSDHFVPSINVLASISSFETLLSRGDEARPLARECLRRLLVGYAKGCEGELSLEQTVAAAAATATEPTAATLILRSAIVPGLLDEPDKTNQLQRHIISVCERLHNDFITFLHIDKSDQTFQKYQTLLSLHSRVRSIVQPLTMSYGDLTSLLSAKKDIIGALNHSIVRSYCAPFFVAEVRSAVELILSRLHQVSLLSSTLLGDIENFNSSVGAAISEIRSVDSFLVRDFLDVFVPQCEALLKSFLALKRSRFSTSITLNAGTSGVLPKRYPLSQSSRVVTIDVPFRNSGPGLATGMSVTAVAGTDDVVLDTENAQLGNISPGGFSVSFRVMVVRPVQAFDLLLDLRWGEIASSEQKSAMFTVSVPAQRHDIDWGAWEYKNPYSSEVAEGTQFVGRADGVRQLSAKLMSRPMESFYITGQKRVGKTSLALAAIERAQSHSTDALYSIYVLWGAVAHAEPLMALRQLGIQIDREVRRRLPYQSSADSSLYDGSLAPLIALFNQALETSPSDRFVITIDEFDEIHPELFLAGNLAETFFANLRALSRCKNVCIVLVGGENMPFVMDRQGQKLNNFARFDLSYFSRDSEWADYQMVVRNPTADILTWQEDAFAELFNLTNGNPYFTKIICAVILKQAFEDRDCDITSTEVHIAASKNLGSLGANSFAHLWQDGIPKRADEREIDVTRRLRVLAAIARCTRKGLPTTAVNIAACRPTQAMLESEVPAVLDDFVRRKVLAEGELGYSFILPVFQMWLADVGLSQLIANSVGEQLASLALERENKATVTSAEIVGLAKSWTTYRGRVIGAEDVRAWLQQVDSVFDQRILFNFLKRTLVVGEPFIRERLKTAHSMVRLSLPEFVIRKRGDKRRDLVLTYVDGEGKSGAHYASVYAEENGIPTDAILPPSDFAKRFAEYSTKNGPVKAAVVIDDVAATGMSLAGNWTKFAETYRTELLPLAIRVVTLFSTSVAEPVIREAISKLGHSDMEYRTCQVLENMHFAFPAGGSYWDNSEQEERARALASDIGRGIYTKNPLGFGDLGLLLVLPNTVPNNTLPILHTASRPNAPTRWSPLFPRIVN